MWAVTSHGRLFTFLEFVDAIALVVDGQRHRLQVRQVLVCVVSAEEERSCLQRHAHVCLRATRVASLECGQLFLYIVHYWHHVKNNDVSVDFLPRHRRVSP